MRRCVVILACLALLAAQQCVVDAQTTHAYFVPTSGGYIIDANGDDWKAITTTHPIQDQYENTVATFKASYDSKSAYFFVTVQDSTPLINSATEATFRELFFKGDALSICFGPRPTTNEGTNQRIVLGKFTSSQNSEVFVMRPVWPQNATAYYYEYYSSTLGIYHVDYVWHVKESKVAFAVSQKGWVAEIEIPWSVVGYTPVAGEFIPFDMEVIGSNGLGTGIISANWWHSEESSTYTADLVAQAKVYPFLWGTALLGTKDVGPQPPIETTSDPAFVPRGVPITFQVPTSGLAVSVNIIEEGSDFVVAELLRAKKLDKGSVTVYWNGRDRENKPVTGNKKYRAKIATFSPLTATFSASVGNSGRPAWATKDGKGSLGGAHYGPKYIIAAETFINNSTSYTNDVILSGSVDEGIDGIRRMNSALLTSWTIGPGKLQNVQGIAVENNIFCYAAMPSTAGAVLTLSCHDASSGSPLLLTKGVTGAAYDTDRRRGSLTILRNRVVYGDAVNGILYINRFNTTTMTWSTQQNVAMPNITSTCRLNADVLLLVYANAVYRYNVTSGERTGPAVSGYQSLSSCAVDVNGNIYVSDVNTNLVYKHRPDGGQVFSYGVAGGRPLRAVPYNPLQFKDIYSMAVGANGVLYIVEKTVAPYRVALIDSNNGTWIRDFYGPTGFSTNVVDVEDSRVMLYNNPITADPMFMEVRIDYDAYQNDPTNSYRGWNVVNIHYLSQTGIDDSVRRTGGIDIWQDWVNVANGNGAGTIFTAKNGLRYMFYSANYHNGAALAMWDATARVWYPVAAINKDNKGWSDDDRNHRVNQTTEIYNIVNAPTNMYLLFADKDLTLYGNTFYISPASIDANGIPSYRGSPVVSTIDPSVNILSDPIYFPPLATSYGVHGCPSTTIKNSMYIASNLGPPRNQGSWDRASDCRVMRVENGTVQWVAGKGHRNYAQTNNGDISILSPFAGEVDGVVLIGDIQSQYQSYSYDGLTLGWLLFDPATQKAPAYGPTSIMTENAAQGIFFKDARTGKRLLVSSTNGDVRVLEVSGPFETGITRSISNNVFLSNPLPRDPADDATAQKQTTYALNYVTMGNGADATFYASTKAYCDAFDYEWQSTVPSLYIYDRTSPLITTLVSEVRLRRDAGELGIFADVLDAPGNFPFFPSASLVSNIYDLFGVAGIEIQIGPSKDGRAQSTAGDTRIFLTATHSGNGVYTGYVFAIKPSSDDVTETSELRPQNSQGIYTSAAPTSPVNLDSLTLVPGATIAIMPRLDKSGYRLEAYIPLALIPEITEKKNVKFLRSQAAGSPTGTLYVIKSESRSDLDGQSFAFNVAVYRPPYLLTQPLNVTRPQRRFAWIADGFSGYDASVMNPARWGAAARPPQVSLIVTTLKTTTNNNASVMDYSHTITTNNTSYRAAVSTNGIFGGGWYTVESANRLVTSPVAIDGFSLSYISGDGGKATNTNWRWPTWDASRLFLSYAPEEVNGELVLASPSGDPSVMSVHITTKLPVGLTGTLHILYGQQSANSSYDSWLNVTDSLSSFQASGLNDSYSDLRVPWEYNEGGQITKESVFYVEGQNDVLINLVRNRSESNLYTYLSAVWVELTTPVFFKAPATVPLYGLAYGPDAAVENVQYYLNSNNNNRSLGISPPGTPLLWKNVPPGIYSVFAVAIDNTQASPPSDPVTVTVYGPVVTSHFPLNASAITSPFRISLGLDVIGSNAVASVRGNGTSNSATFTFNVAFTEGPKGNFTSVNIVVPPGSVNFTIRVVDATGAYITRTLSYSVITPTQPPKSDATKAVSGTFGAWIIAISTALLVLIVFEC